MRLAVRFRIAILISASLIFASSERFAVASVGSGVQASQQTTTSALQGAAAQIANPGIVQPECSTVCGDLKKKLKANSRKVEIEHARWQQRLGLKHDVVRYDDGLSAAEELLHFMATHYRVRPIGNQMNPAFLTYMMLKCFPEAHVDQTHARMSKLVDTLWVAKNLSIEKSIASCK
jgi:hypothetical protein